MLRRILVILRALLYGWALALLELIRRRLAQRRRDTPPPPQKVGEKGSRAECVPIDHPAFCRPDPLIYDQYYLQSLGLAVTWDNPDITLLEGGVPVPSGQLRADTDYEVRVRVWNASTDAWVVQMPVHLSYLDFGIGTGSVPVDTRPVSVGVLGAPSQPGFVSFTWHTPPRAGHYCLQALLDPADDKNYANNLGQENTDVGVAQSPATFTFELRNASRREHRYQFTTDAYMIGTPEPCPDDDQVRDPDVAQQQRKRRLARHGAAGHPLPAGWRVELSPAEPALAPGAQITVQAVVTPPNGWAGRQAINVNAFDEHEDLAGGVTLTVVDRLVP